MIKATKAILFICVLCLSSCNGGGSGLSNNACDDLNLPTRIINGTACGDLQSSPVVRLILDNSVYGKGYCSGTMISNTAVLTAAHCFIGLVTKVQILSGDENTTVMTRTASSWSIHPDFIFRDDVVFNDVAIVRLSIPLSVPTLPILISSSAEAGDVVSIFGYGVDEEGNFDFAVLESGEMRVTNVTINHVQADFNGEGSNTCKGDSGGPLTFSSDGTTTIIGITSSGTQTDCLKGDNSYFTNIQSPSVLNFIQAQAPDAQYF